jgi:hypothetical protein
VGASGHDFADEKREKRGRDGFFPTERDFGFCGGTRWTVENGGERGDEIYTGIWVNFEFNPIK